MLDSPVGHLLPLGQHLPGPRLDGHVEPPAQVAHHALALQQQRHPVDGRHVVHADHLAGGGGLVWFLVEWEDVGRGVGRGRSHLFGLDVAEHGDLLFDRVLQRRGAAAHDLMAGKHFISTKQKKRKTIALSRRAWK